MSYLVHINGKVMQRFESYNNAVKYAILRMRGDRDVYMTRDGDVIPIIKVGDYVMNKNVMLEVVDIHRNGVDLHGEFRGITINQMHVDPATLRFPGSDESSIFYWENMAAMLDEKKPSQAICLQLIAELKGQRNEDPQTPTEEEENCRVDGFICAIEQYLSR